MQSFFEFDDRVTARCNGFEGAMHYYTSSSSRQYLNRIRIPTLIVHASDDPFMHAKVIPEAGELSPDVELDLHRHGAMSASSVDTCPGGRATGWMNEFPPGCANKL